jgi:hypothetical protein
MKTETRDILIGIASIVFSVCAGIWTLFNYNVNQKKIELEAIFSINKKLEIVKLNKVLTIEKNESDGMRSESKLIHELWSEVRFRFHQIKKPPFMDNTDWNNNWINLYEYIKQAFEDDFDMYKDKIDDTWNEILRKKDIQSLDMIVKQKKIIKAIKE